MLLQRAWCHQQGTLVLLQEQLMLPALPASSGDSNKHSCCPCRPANSCCTCWLLSSISRPRRRQQQ